MIARYNYISFLVFACLAMYMPHIYAHSNLDERHVQVSMRMIGHEVLLNACDDTSRVLPIEKIEDRYKIPFSSEFEFDPSELVLTVNQVLLDADLARGYIIEVENCDSHKVVYSYEMGYTFEADMIPCGGRVLPKSCYTLFVTFMDTTANAAGQIPSFLEPPSKTSSIVIGGKYASKTAPKKSRSYLYLFSFLIIPVIFLIGWKKYFPKKKILSELDPDVLMLGDFEFNNKRMTLSYQNEKTELTSKEADLLFLLYNSTNKTVEREEILKDVWGDEGDYTGRTLDVFISKLRKKLVADSTLKIVNIRGVGYKLIMNT